MTTSNEPCAAKTSARTVLAVVAATSAALALSCSSDSAQPTPALPSGVTKVEGVTWYKDVQPIVETSCVSCHTMGGLAPFALTSYDLAKQYAPVMSSAVVSGHMPPWMPSADCQHFVGERRLSQDQVNQIYSWNIDGAPLGDPKDQKAAPPPPQGLASPSLTLDWGQAYTPTGSDDYHCFMLDPKLTQDQDLIAYEFVPNQRQEVHHTLIYSAARTDVQAADDAAPGLGWPCGGGSNVKGATLVATWVPGSPAIAYPTGTGISIPAANVLIAQMHYNCAACGTMEVG